MPLSVFKLDSSPGEAAVCVLSKGAHPIGRGPLLQCTDKRVSTHHALINVDEGCSSIISTHKNPCFYQSGKSNTIIILPENNPIAIKTGDKFGLFPDKFWFKFRFEPEESGVAMSQNLKRPLEVKSDSIEEKRQKLIVEDDVIVSTDAECECTSETPEELEDQAPFESKSNFTLKWEQEDKATNKGDKYKCVTDNPEEGSTAKTESKVDQDLESPSELKLDFVESDNRVTNTEKNEDPANIEKVQNCEVINGCHEDDNKSKNENVTCQVSTSKKEELSGLEDENEGGKGTDQLAIDTADPGEAGNDGKPSASTKREKCWYGSTCYRKNSYHRFQFSHPGDADYDSDPNDDRPTCSYGANCYRRNKDHRKVYKHPGKPADQKRKQRRRAKVNKNDGESSEDDYDYNDPFLSDGSEDEYEEESWSEYDSDEEWENSQNASDDEDTRNLLKEAKRFTKAKK